MQLAANLGSSRAEKRSDKLAFTRMCRRIPERAKARQKGYTKARVKGEDLRI
jgi:hypothetical protein